LFKFRGGGFKMNEAYSCLLVHGIESATTVASAVSPSEIQCVAPQWQYGAAKVSLHVFDSLGSEMVTAGPQFEFTYKSAWTSKDVSQGPAKGGTIVTVNGVGFQDISVDYTCVFKDFLTSVLSHAEAISRNAIACVVPEWPYAATDVDFSVHDEEGIRYEGSTPLYGTFDQMGLFNGVFIFREGWDGSIGDSTFSSYGANSYMPTVAQIHGFGLTRN
jgi:hypothetical protein